MGWPDGGGRTMVDTGSFVTLMAGVRLGDDEAVAEVFGRYVHRLIRLAGGQFAPSLLARADPEELVQSALASFFARYGRGQFAVDDWGELWCLLTVITLRKCSKKRRYLRAGRRDARREGRLDPAGDGRATPRIAGRRRPRRRS